MRIKTHLSLLGLLIAFGMHAQTNYSNTAQQTARLQALTKSYPSLSNLSSITKTTGGKDIWKLTIGTGKMEAKPAIAIIGGIEGNQILGTELAIGFAENLLQGSNTDSIRNLLNKTTFYIFPNMSPDATEQYFSALKYERLGNAKATDDDRDGKTNEDGFEDLDGNKKITWIRVESPVGEYKIHPDDPRVLVKADPGKGEKGKYLLYSEGIDNDKDGVFNEDGEGGIIFNKNFSFKHPSFTAGSGEFAVSENETRALLDQLYEMFNVFAVVSFGSNNNLSNPLTFNSAAASQNIVSGWLEPDVKVNGMISELYNKVVNQKDAPKTSPAGGDFLSWAYFHYGRYSFSTPGWWVPKVQPDTAKKEKPLTIDDPGANYLRWASKQGITGTFTEWKPIQHPDFPGQNVEVGGLDPFALSTPPVNNIAELTKKHAQFLVKLASYQPELDLVNVRTEKLGNNISRITLNVINKGAMASHSKLGERTYWVKRIQVKVNTGNNQVLVSGKKIQLLNSLEGYGSVQLSWLVKGNGTISIEAGSPTTGSKTVDINL